MILTVSIVRIKKWNSRRPYPSYWLIKDEDTKTLATCDSAPEAIKIVEDNGWILKPDYEVAK